MQRFPRINNLSFFLKYEAIELYIAGNAISLQRKRIENHAQCTFLRVTFGHGFYILVQPQTVPFLLSLIRVHARLLDSFPLMVCQI